MFCFGVFLASKKIQVAFNKRVVSHSPSSTLTIQGYPWIQAEVSQPCLYLDRSQQQDLFHVITVGREISGGDHGIERKGNMAW